MSVIGPRPLLVEYLGTCYTKSGYNRSYSEAHHCSLPEAVWYLSAGSIRRIQMKGCYNVFRYEDPGIRR